MVLFVRLFAGAIEVDMSALTGESEPTERVGAAPPRRRSPRSSTPATSAVGSARPLAERFVGAIGDTIAPRTRPAAGSAVITLPAVRYPARGESPQRRGSSSLEVRRWPG